MFVLMSCAPTQQERGVQSKDLVVQWEFQSQSEAVLRPASVPGCVHLDLLRNNIIQNPFYENNELKQRWIEYENWEYLTEFNLSSKEHSNQHIELEFEGLDTRADVYLNDSLLIKADNMFRSWKVEVKNQMKIGKNKLKVIFYSPVNYYKDQVNDYPHRLPSGCETVEVQVGPFIRKAAYHFGWDWGPRFVTCGIWKPVRLNFWNKSRIKNINCSTIQNNGEPVSVEVQVEVESSEEGKVGIAINGEKQDVKLDSGVNYVTTTLEYSTHDLWWPNGFGDQTLQTIHVELYDSLQTIQEKSIQYGVRTIELVNEPDSIGTSFYFKVNGEPIFIKGANYIPQDVFLTRVTDEDYEKLILQAKQANFNMLRVWGGGVYEKDIFYDLCDKHGILVWQDLMFAGSMYPITESFRRNVLEEVKENVIRLRNHPCLALWCGNNEIEVAFNNWGWQGQFGWNQSDSEALWEGYQSLFQDAIPRLLKKESPLINYVSTSPLSNWGKAKNFNHGSMHYWGVWHGKEPFKNFKKNVPRFMVEYGFQSFPDSTALSSSIGPDHFSLDDTVMKNRQKSYIGNDLIVLHSEELFGKASSFSDFIKNSQKTQAVAYKTAIKYHRLNRKHCMGTLFWQFNDCWPGPSWSVIDYYKNEKPAFDAVSDMYRPLVAFVELINDSIKVTAVSDQANTAFVTLTLTAQSDNDQNELWKKQLDVSPNGSQVVLFKPLDDFEIQTSLFQSICIELESSDQYNFSDTIKLHQD